MLPNIIKVITQFTSVKTSLNLTSTCKDFINLLDWKTLLLRDFKRDYESYISRIKNDNRNSIIASDDLRKITETFKSLKEYELLYREKYKELEESSAFFDEDHEISIGIKLSHLEDDFEEIDKLQINLNDHLNKYILDKPLVEEEGKDLINVYKEFYEKSKYTTCKYPVGSFFFSNCYKKTLAFSKFCEEHNNIVEKLKLL